MKERIKLIRKHYGLNQSAFAKRLGVTRSTVCQYEAGTCGLSTATILSICREFNVNKDWLETGSGDMLNNTTDSEELARTVAKILADSDEFVIKTFLALGQLSPQQWQLVKDFVDKIKSGT